jgi:pimeloyl-ACP methyl ester carboxylesterase
MPAAEIRKLSLWRGEITARVQVAGSGAPLVWFHGAYGLAWDPFLERLAGAFQVFAPEHPGTTPGDPDAIRPLRDLWDLVLYYDELFGALGLDSPRVVGHSFGGMVAAELAASYPARASRLVLLSPLGLWRDDRPVPNYMALPAEELPRRIFADPQGPLAKAMFEMPADPEQAQERAVQSIWTLACTGKFVWPLPDKGLRRRIHRIAAPTLVVWGKRDGLVDPIYAEEFRKEIRGSRVLLVDGAAHVPQLEQLDTVSRAVVDFLR